jgi:hypothetical protein
VADLVPIGRLVIRVAIRPSFRAGTEIELRDRKRLTRTEDYYLLVKHGAETWEAPIERAEVTRLVGLLQHPIPILAENGVSIDGTSYEVECGDGQTTARYHWANSTPQGWEPLAEIVATLKRLAPARR